MFRASYCERKAIEMYSQGKTKAEISEMLLAENAKETEVEALADKYNQYYLFRQKEKQKQQRKAADREILIGGVILAAGLVLTLFSYFSIGSERYVLFPGLMIAGLVFLLKGIFTKANLNQEVTQQTTL